MSEEASLDGVRHAGTPHVVFSYRNGGTVRRTTVLSVLVLAAMFCVGSVVADDRLCYYVPEFSDEYFQSYISRVKQEEFYDTGVEFTNKDHLLTMQTCVYLREDLRLIVVAKEVERKAIE